jgi:hypothetical protein
MTGPWAWYSVSERMQMIPNEHDGDEVEVGDTSSSLMVDGLILSTCGIMGVVDRDWVGEGRQRAKGGETERGRGVEREQWLEQAQLERKKGLEREQNQEWQVEIR